MSIGIGRNGSRALALASLSLLFFGSSCDLAGDKGGPGSGPGLVGSVPAPPPVLPAVLQTIRASVGEFVEPNSSSFECSISANGRFVAFSSFSNNLVTDDTNNQSDIFVLDRDFDENLTLDEPGTLAISRVSVAFDGSQAQGGGATTPSISQDGQFVAFQSFATNLIVGGSAGGQIFVRDRDPLGNGFDGVDGTTLLVSRATGALGAIGNSTSSIPSISGDGTRVVYESVASNLAGVDNNGTVDVYARFISSDTTERISIEAAGNPDGDGDLVNPNSFSNDPAISRNGRWVAFVSGATDVVVPDTNGFTQDVYVRDLDNLGNPTIRVSLTNAGGQAANFSARPSVAESLAGDLLVCFDCNDPNMAVGDADFTLDVFVRNVTQATTTLVSLATGAPGVGVKGNNTSAVSQLNADGTHVAFCSAATNLDPRHVSAFFQVYLRDIANNTTELASVSTSGNAGNSTSVVIVSSFYYGLSADASAVTFGSFASNLIDDDFNPNSDIFIRNFFSGETYRASEKPGNEANAACSGNALAGNAKFVAFTSTATNILTLTGGATPNGQPQVYVRDIANDVTRLVSIEWTGNDFGNGISQGATVSADGRFVAFESFTTNLISDFDTNGFFDVYLYDLAAGEMTAISRDVFGDIDFNVGDSRRPSISSTGQFVAFDSDDTFQVFSDNNGLTDVFVRNIVTATTTRVSVDSGGNESANGGSLNASISGNGRFVAFESDADNLAAGDLGGFRDIFLHDRDVNGNGIFDEAGDIATLRISVGPANLESDGDSFNAAVSADGNFVVFESVATNLLGVGNDTNAGRDVYIFNRQTGVVSRVSVDQNGAETNAGANSGQPSISQNGDFIAFSSDATNLIVGSPTAGTQVFRKNRQTGAVILVSTTTGAGNGASSNPSISSDGRFISFDTAATNLAPPDSSSASDVLLRGPLP